MGMELLLVDSLYNGAHVTLDEFKKRTGTGRREGRHSVNPTALLSILIET